MEWGGGPAFNAEALHRRSYIPVTCLVRAELARAMGGSCFVTDKTGASNDDRGFYLALYRAGAVFAHVHEPTFLWHHHGPGRPGVPGNTSGRPGQL